MSEKGPQPDSKEATEVRLCAYLEGDLSPVEKKEIERHLSANPQHRQLLADLARTRDWMRSVPRETSPVDLGEMFQGHVERQMLLDDSADHSEGMSINRWPQYVLVAAITMLTLGLGAVLVVILRAPSGGQNTVSSTINTGKVPSTTMPDESRETRAIADATSPTAAAKLAAPVAGDAASFGATDDQTAVKALLARRARGDEANTLKSRLDTAGISVPVDRKTVCFVVTADSPPAAMDQVRGFFDRHQIVFSQPATDPLHAGFANRGGGFGFGNARGDDVAKDEADKQKLAGAVGQNNSNSAVNGGNIGGGNSGGGNSGGGGSLNQLQQNAQQLTQNAPPEPAVETPGSAAKNFAGNTFPRPGSGPDQLTPIAPPASQTIFVAPSMTPLELELLNASLAGEALKQSVDRVTLWEVPKAPPALGAIATGSTMTITIPQLVGPGIEKTNVVKVADDGTISLPMIDPVPAAGITQDELQKRIANKYREANLIDSATVTIAVAPTSPPAGQLKQSATRAAGDAPGTRPVKDISLVNVVVVIEPTKLPASQTPAAPGK